MAAYVLANVQVEDPAAFEEYRQRVPASIAAHGGRYLCRGGKFEVLEGEFDARRMIIIEFPSMEAVRAWYDSAEYQELVRLRQRAAKTLLITVEGV